MKRTTVANGKLEPAKGEPGAELEQIRRLVEAIAGAHPGCDLVVRATVRRGEVQAVELALSEKVGKVYLHTAQYVSDCRCEIDFG